MSEEITTIHKKKKLNSEINTDLPFLKTWPANEIWKLG